MSLLRQSVFTGALALIAMPAFAQIKAEDLWKSWENSSSEQQYQLKAEDLTRSGDRLVAKNVSLTSTAENMSVVNTIPEVVLREAGQGVEVTASPEWKSETTVKGDDGAEQTRIVTNLSQSGYVLTVTGTAENPVYALRGDSFSFSQNMPISGESGKPEGQVNTSGTFTGMTGNFVTSPKVEGAPQEVTYDFAAKSAKIVVKADNPNNGERGGLTLDMADVSSDFKGVLPPQAANETSLNALLRSGLQGVTGSKSGPVSFAFESTSPEMPLKIEGGLTSTSASFGLTGGEIRVDLDLNGIHVGQAGSTPSNSDILIRGLARLDTTTTNDEELFKSGKLDLTVNQSQALLDNLSAIGLIPADQMMGVQMMIAMFTKAGTTPGSLTSTVEVTETGDFLVNGQSMQ